MKFAFASLGVLSSQKGPLFSLFISCRKCSYYGGAELLEAVNALRQDPLVFCRQKTFKIDLDNILGKRISVIAVPIGFQRAVHRKRLAHGVR